MVCHSGRAEAGLFFSPKGRKEWMVSMVIVGVKIVVCALCFGASTFYVFSEWQLSCLALHAWELYFYSDREGKLNSWKFSVFITSAFIVRFYCELAVIYGLHTSLWYTDTVRTVQAKTQK